MSVPSYGLTSGDGLGHVSGTRDARAPGVAWRTASVRACLLHTAYSGAAVSASLWAAYRACTGLFVRRVYR